MIVECIHADEHKGPKHRPNDHETWISVQVTKCLLCSMLTRYQYTLGFLRPFEPIQRGSRKFTLFTPQLGHWTPPCRAKWSGEDGESKQQGTGSSIPKFQAQSTECKHTPMGFPEQDQGHGCHSLTALGSSCLNDTCVLQTIGEGSCLFRSWTLLRSFSISGRIRLVCLGVVLLARGPICSCEARLPHVTWHSTGACHMVRPCIFYRVRT